MRGHQSADQYADLDKGREELVGDLRRNAFFCSLERQQQERILTGDHFYIRGMNAAARAAGWDFKKFLSFYSYFSSHAHSAPMSFFRTRQHRISYADPSDAQKATVATALGVAEYCLLKPTLAHLNASLRAKAAFDAIELDKFEKSLRDWQREFELTT